MKMKEIGLKEGVCPWHLLDPPMNNCIGREGEALGKCTPLSPISLIFMHFSAKIL